MGARLVMVDKEQEKRLRKAKALAKLHISTGLSPKPLKSKSKVAPSPKVVPTIVLVKSAQKKSTTVTAGKVQSNEAAARKEKDARKAKALAKLSA